MSEQSTKDVQVKGTKRDGVFDEYDHKIHRMGRIGTFVSLITWFLPAIGITLIYKVRLNWGQILAATIAVVSAFGLQGFSSHLHFSHAGGGRDLPVLHIRQCAAAAASMRHKLSGNHGS